MNQEINPSAEPSKIDALARELDADHGVAEDGIDTSGGARFSDLGLDAMLIKALNDSGYTQPTPVQVQAIPVAMNGTDLKVASSTGSGKTAAFMLPALQRLIAARGEGKRREKGVVHGPRILVLAPTRELAMQVSKAASTYGRHMQGLRVATVVGGVPYAAQLKALRGPLDVLIATPGRLLDHLGTGVCVLSNLEVLVLDEADRMLDMGFIEDIEHIASQTPPERQTLMFSATFAGHVGKLAARLTRPDAQSIDVASHTDSHDNIEQRLHYADHFAHKNDLLDSLLTQRDVDQAVIFTSTQRDADILADRLADMGHEVAALHGGMPQGRRTRVLQALRQRQLRILVATDVAARGIDVPTITHVINYGMPMKPEDYVHRIGRTGRAGRSGLAVTIAERRDIPMLRRIERYTTQNIPVATIAGLEPKAPAPSNGPMRHGKPMPGHRGPREGGYGGGGRSFGGHRDGGGFGGGHREGGFGQREGGFGGGNGGGYQNRGPRRDGPSEGSGGYNPRAGFNEAARHEDVRFRPATEERPAFGAPRHQDDGRKPFGDKKPSFGGNKPFGGKPSFGGPKPSFGGNKFGGPKRQGGFKRED